MAVTTSPETQRQLEANKAVMRRYIEELWNQRNWDVIDEIIDPRYKSEPPSFPGEWGLEDLKKNCPPFMAMYPDGKWTTLDMVAEGDRVACAWEFNATHTRDGMGIRATGKKVKVLVIGIYTLANGKIISLRELNVGVDFYTAFGLPQPDPAAG
jgi:predicted ester cyclase